MLLDSNKKLESRVKPNEFQEGFFSQAIFFLVCVCVRINDIRLKALQLHGVSQVLIQH